MKSSRAAVFDSGWCAGCRRGDGRRESPPERPAKLLLMGGARRGAHTPRTHPGQGRRAPRASGRIQTPSPALGAPAQAPVPWGCRRRGRGSPASPQPCPGLRSFHPMSSARPPLGVGVISSQGNILWLGSCSRCRGMLLSLAWGGSRRSPARDAPSPAPSPRPCSRPCPRGAARWDCEEGFLTALAARQGPAPSTAEQPDPGPGPRDCLGAAQPEGFKRRGGGRRGVGETKDAAGAKRVATG